MIFFGIVFVLYFSKLSGTSGFWDFHLKPIMQDDRSYIWDSGGFIDKIKRIGKIPQGFLSSNCRGDRSISKHNT